jgi:hypothetical protein
LALGLPPDYTEMRCLQWQFIVKVHRVFPSCCRKAASSRLFQFQWAHVGDSGEVVTPFMRVGTYPTRNFATFGPSELRPPFTGASFKSQNFWTSPCCTGQVSVPIPHLTILQRPVFLINSRHPQFCANTHLECSPFFRSYRVNLPSSFNVVVSLPLWNSHVYLCRFLVRCICECGYFLETANN